MQRILAALPSLLLPWYDRGHRDLPWRRDRQPYHVWLSEIMLQQTRVEAVKGYYARFLEALPTVQDLAACEDDRLHKLWEGLGYYSRVRNLKKAAQAIVRDHGGTFPGEYAQVRSLPGIGDYTAGAICSICFDLPTPAVDGNVLRLVSRLCNDDTPIDQPAFKKQVTQMLLQVYPARAGDFTQALMELGATLCGPNRAPECDACPCRELCLAKKAGRQTLLPVKSPKKPRKAEEKTVFILRCGQDYALLKRPNKGLLAGLWQFPEAPGTLEAPQALDWLEKQGVTPSNILRQADKTHIFTHVEWKMRGFYLELRQTAGPWQWFSEEEVAQTAALPTAFKQFWDERHI